MTRKIDLSLEERRICEALKDAVMTHRPRITVKALASKVGLTSGQLDHMLNGRTKPRPEVVMALRRELGLPGGWPYSVAPSDYRAVLGGSGSVDYIEKPSDGRRVSIAGTAMVPISVVGGASAGDGQTNVDVDDRQIWVPERLSQIGSLGWVVDGDSMVPYLESGDIAIFRERREPRRRYTYLVRRSNGEYRVKNVEWEGGEWILKSLNPAFEPEPLGSHELLGILVGWYRARGRRETMDSDPDGLMLEVGQ